MTEDLLNAELHYTDRDADADMRAASEALVDLVNIIARNQGAPGPVAKLAGFYFKCDGCGVTVPMVNDSIVQTRAEYAKRGWVIVGADDFCPNCRQGEPE